MGIYDELQGVAQEVFAEFQQGVIVYNVVTPGNGPVDNPGPSTPTPFTIKATAIGVQYKYVAISLAVATDLQISAPFDARYTPDVKDYITVDGVRHKIVSIKKMPAAGTPVAFLFIIRRGM